MMDLKQDSSNDWCEDDFNQDDDINRPGPSGLKQNTGHFLIGGMKFKNIDFIKDTFTDDNIVLTDTNGQPYDVLTSSDMQSMTVLDNQATNFGMTKHSQTVILPEYNNMSEVDAMVSMPEQYFQNNLYNLKTDMSQVSNTHSVMENLSHNNSLAHQLSFIPKQTNNYVNNLGNNEDMILETGNNRFLFSENGRSYIEVTLKENDVLNNDDNEFYVVPQSSSVQENHIAQKIVSIDDLSLLSSPKSHNNNVELLVNHEELVDDIDTCDIAVVDESQISLNSSQLKGRIDDGSQSISLDVDHHQQHSSGFQRMSKETIEKIAEEFVRQPQCIDEDISINFISRINPKSSAKIEYWCEDCNKLYQDESNCPIHQVNTIIDLAVQSRARASLPTTHLKIMRIKVENNLNNKFGVFARKTIPKHTQFGPLEGVFVKDEECVEESINDEFKYLLEVDKEFKLIDVSSEDNSNWMCFVRPAKTKQEQNMIVDQIGDYLYFTTTRSIFQREELLVGYSTFYAHKRGLHALPNTVNDCEITSEIRKPFKSKIPQELSKQSKISKSNLSNRGNMVIKTSSTICKHTMKKKKLSNRFNKNNAQCNLCSNMQNNSKNTFRSKLKSNNSIKNIWVCVACDLKFSKRETIAVHSKFHEDEFDVEKVTLTNTNCPECNSAFHHTEELIKHVYMHSFTDVRMMGNQTIYNCYQCDRRYRNAIHLKAHQAKHKVNELKPYKCNMCDKRFLNTVVLTCHVRTHFEGVIYDCPMCRLTFVDLKSLKGHVYSHAVNNIFYCPMCPLQFKTYKLIRKHIRARHHGIEFGCEYCNSSFNSRFNLNLHMLSHSDQRDFLCTMCGKQYKRKDKLQMHMNKIHFSKKSPSKTQLKVEARAVRKAKQIQVKSTKSMLEYENSEYKCDKCVVGFKKRGVFVNHMASRHPEISLDSVPSLNQPIMTQIKMYMCLYCDKMYKTNAKRKSHIIKNHPNCKLPEKPTDKTVAISENPSNQMASSNSSVFSQVHSCQWCYKQYVLKNKLLKHQRTHHYHLLPPFLQQPKSWKKLETKDTTKTDHSTYKSESQPQIVNLQFTDTDGYELTATDIQLDNPIEPGSIIAIKRPIKDNSEFVSQAMRDLGINTVDDHLNEEQYYQILDTQGDVAYAQAIDAPVALLSFDSQTIQQVLSSCDTAVTTQQLSPPAVALSTIVHSSTTSHGAPEH